jgi:hypothetical protein
MGINGIRFVRTCRIALIASCCLSAIASVRAQGTVEQREACTPDAVRLCSSEIPDVGRVTACMEAKEASLSPRCRAVFQTAGDRAGPPPQLRDHRTLSTYARRREAHAPSRYAHNPEPYAPRYRAWVRAEEPYAPRHRAWMRSEEAVGIEREQACASGDVPPEVCNTSAEYPPYPPPYPTQGEYPPYPPPDPTQGEYPPYPPPDPTQGEYPPYAPPYPTQGEYPPYAPPDPTQGEYPPYPPPDPTQGEYPPDPTPMDGYYLADPEIATP